MDARRTAGKAPIGHTRASYATPILRTGFREVPDPQLEDALRHSLHGAGDVVDEALFPAGRHQAIEVVGLGCLNSFGILVKNRLLARAAQNGVSMFVSVYRAATARERSFRDVPPDTV